MFGNRFADPLNQAVLRLWTELYPESRLRDEIRADSRNSIQTAPTASAERQGKPRRRIAKLQRDVSNIATEFLSVLLESEHKETLISHTMRRHAHWSGSVHLAADFHLISELSEELEPGDRWYMRDYPEDNEKPVFWPIDFAGSVRKEGDEFHDKPSFFIYRVCTVSPSEVRSKVSRVLPKMVRVSSAYVNLDKSPFYSESSISGLGWNNTWVEIDDVEFQRATGSVRGDILIQRRTVRPSGEVDNLVRMAMGTKLTERYSWHVAFGTEPGPRMLLPTNPSGCLELFRTRELASGEKRRGALRHWVSEHYRDRSNDPGALNYVCDHLRGHTRFCWNGIDCEILVSEYDLEKNQYFKRRASDWRAQRSHNRVKVRVKDLRIPGRRPAALQSRATT